MRKPESGLRASKPQREITAAQMRDERRRQANELGRELGVDVIVTDSRAFRVLGRIAVDESEVRKLVARLRGKP
jgi:hypothetical protein